MLLHHYVIEPLLRELFMFCSEIVFIIEQYQLATSIFKKVMRWEYGLCFTIGYRFDG